MQLPPILVLDRGHVDYAPDLALAAVVPAEQVDELAGVDRVGLGPLAPAVDFDGAGVDDDVVDAPLGQGAVQPEAIATGLVAGADWGVGRKSEARLGLGDLPVQ